MGLISQITTQLNRFFPNRQEKTTADEIPERRKPSDLMNRLAAEKTRRGKLQVCREMYGTDPRAKEVIRTLARDAVKGGFTISVTGGVKAKEAQEAADALIMRLKLFKKLDDWLRLSERDGDTFLELGINQERLISKVTRKPTPEMHRASNRFDEFDDPSRAYWQGTPLWGSEPPADAIWFADWQIVHARWEHDEGDRYGQPQFASATGAFKRMTEGETDIAIRRKTRAGMKYLHVVEGDDTAVEKYKKENKDTLDNPFAALADFFTNKKGSIQAVQGDARLAEIGDVTHHIETWGTASPVPLALLGYGQDLNRDVLGDQREQYNETLPGVTEWVEDQLLNPILELQWLLLGIWPESLTYEIHWAREEKEQAKARQEAAEAAKGQAEAVIKVAEAGIKLAGMRWPAEIVADIVLRMLQTIDPEIETDKILKAIKQAAASQPDEIDRMAKLPPLLTKNGNGKEQSTETAELLKILFP